MADEQRSEEEAIAEISKILQNVKDSGAIPRILAWATGKFVDPNSPQAQLITTGMGGGKVRRGAGTRGKSGKGSKKRALSIDKDLNLRPDSADSLEAFVDKKRPTSNIVKNVVCVYYLEKHLNMEKVTANQVLTCYKSLSWRVPADIANTLQQAGSKGWLDTSDSENILLTTLGENLVEHDLPKS